MAASLHNLTKTQGLSVISVTLMFMRRFPLHVLPDGFHRIRHYGLFANGHRVAMIARCRELLDVPTAPAKSNDNNQEERRDATKKVPAPVAAGRCRSSSASRARARAAATLAASPTTAGDGHASAPPVPNRSSTSPRRRRRIPTAGAFEHGGRSAVPWSCLTAMSAYCSRREMMLPDSIVRICSIFERPSGADTQGTLRWLDCFAARLASVS